MVIQRWRFLKKQCASCLHGWPHACAIMISIRSPDKRCMATSIAVAREALDDFSRFSAEYSHGAMAQRQELTVYRDDEISTDASASAGLFELSDNVDGMIRTLISLCKQGRLEVALLVLNLLEERGFQIHNYACVCVLQLCMSQRAFTEGKQVHDYIVRHLVSPSIVLANTLINFYAKYGCLQDARRVFDRMQDHDLFSWTITIEAFAKSEHSEVALQLFVEMEAKGIKPDEICFLSILKACGNLGAVKEGRILHTYVIICGWGSNVLVQSSLIEMYLKCRRLDDAFQVFLCMRNRDVVVWNLMIAAYAESNQFSEAFKLLELMKQESIVCNAYTFLCILKACARLDQIKKTHVSGIASDNDLSLCFYNSLINRYFKFEASSEACQVFERMPIRDVVSWNSMMSGYIQQGFFQEALGLLEKMVQADMKPDYLTAASALKACTSIAALEEGKEIHRFIYAIGMEKNKFLASTLIDMYGKCGDLQDAWKVFGDIVDRDVVIWNSMISVLVGHESCEEALQLFGKMGLTGYQADDATFVNILKACAILSLEELGKQIHAYIIEKGIQLTIIQNTLVDMYLKCGLPYDALAVFNRLGKSDVVSWNVMISGYAQLECSEEALELFQKMLQEEVQPDKVTCLGVVKACANLTVYKHAKEIQACIDKAGLSSDVSVRNAMVDMYGKCGRMDVAYEIFKGASERDIVSWNAILTGYVQHGGIEEVSVAFHRLLLEGVEPDDVTFITVLKSCADVAGIWHGKMMHALVRETQHTSNSFVTSTLFDMYAKCGNIVAACKLFEGAMEQDRVSCNALIAGYSQHGLMEEAMQIFSRTKLMSAEWELDHISYVAIMSACSHLGRVAEGYYYFASMQGDHSVVPSVELYVCLIDLLGRSGQLHEAHMVAGNMGFQPNVDVWMAVLSACKALNYADLAKNVADFVIELDFENTAAILLLSNTSIVRV